MQMTVVSHFAAVFSRSFTEWRGIFTVTRKGLGNILGGLRQGRVAMYIVP